jgi:diaminohydroxyphosphoribosylaminopyrimidine deaminase / 5-amino-6-(5-phosphoribosylamino)uracil reductase
MLNLPPLEERDTREPARLDALFAPFEAGTASQPFVIAQLGQSLDGRIATLSGDSKYINGGAGLDHLHRLRAHVDAVVVGAGTVVADDPLLTVRRVEGRDPARVVIDPIGRVPATARCLAAGGAPVIVICAEGAGTPGHAEAIRLPAQDRTIAPAAIVTALGRRGFRRILVEGGARTVSAFIDTGMVDRLHVLVAPIILGSGKPPLALKPIATLTEALRPATKAYVLSDGNVLFDCDLRRTSPGMASL